MTVHSLPPAAEPVARRNILGVAVAALGWNEAIEHLTRLAAERRFTRVGFLNAHNANLACANSDFSRVLETFLVLPDGIGVDVASHLLYGAKFPANLNGTDFIPALLASPAPRLTVGLLGAARGNVEGAACALSLIAPQHDIVVIRDGFYDPADEPEILERIAQIRPDVLLVGMGVPRQEFFIGEKLTADHCTLPIAVGALLDFLSGAVPRAPSWMRGVRFEWLFRLWVEPGRLWRRYVLGNPAFLARVLRQKFNAGKERRVPGARAS